MITILSKKNIQTTFGLVISRSLILLFRKPIALLKNQGKRCYRQLPYTSASTKITSTIIFTMGILFFGQSIIPPSLLNQNLRFGLNSMKILILLPFWSEPQ